MAKFIITGSYAFRKDKLILMYVSEDLPTRLCLELDGAKQIYANNFKTKEEMLKEYARILSELEED